MNYKRITDLPGVRIAREAMVVGDVTIGEDSCVLFYSTVRGDEGTITIGRETNIQESCTIHASIEGDVVIGDNVTLYQGVTLGGTGKEKGKRHPTLEDNVMVSAGAKILGSFTIGENSKIGAGSVVLEEVPPNCTVVGVPGRIVRMGDKKIPRTDMDQVHLPDPVLNDLRELHQDNLKLKKQLKELESQLKCVTKKDAGDAQEGGHYEII